MLMKQDDNKVNTVHDDIKRIYIGEYNKYV